MKKNYFDPTRRNFTPWSGSGRLQKISSSRVARHAAYRTGGDDDDEDDDDEDDVKGKDAQMLVRSIERRIEKKLKKYDPETAMQVRSVMEEVIGKKNKDGVYEGGTLDVVSLRAMADPKTGVMAAVLKQGEEITKLRTQIGNMPEDMSIRSQVGRWMESNKDVIKAIKEGNKRDLPELNIDLRGMQLMTAGNQALITRDANSPMLPANTMPNGSTYITRFEVDPTVNQPLRPEPTLWDTLKKGRTGAQTYAWVNKKPTEGAAGFIAPGVYKPAISFTLESELSTAKKIAANEKMATELLEDIDGFTSWVETELRYQLDIKLNAAVATGESSATDIDGVETLANPFPANSGCEAVNPNIWDAISACVDVLRARFLTGPIICRIHPIDLGNAKRTKAENQGQIFIPPVTGAVIIPDNTMTKGSLTVFAADYYKILIYKGFSLKWGWENQDFTKNLVTVIGEMRLHQFVSDNYIDEFAITDTIENIEAAIDVAPMP